MKTKIQGSFSVTLRKPGNKTFVPVVMACAGEWFFARLKNGSIYSNYRRYSHTNHIERSVVIALLRVGAITDAQHDRWQRDRLEFKIREAVKDASFWMDRTEEEAGFKFDKNVRLTMTQLIEAKTRARVCG